MASERVEWFRWADTVYECDMGRLLKDADTGDVAALASVTGVYLDRRESGLWVDRTSWIALGLAAQIVDGARSGVVDGAVRWMVTGLAVSTVNPPEGHDYRWRILATRSDAGEAAGEMPLTIKL